MKKNYGIKKTKRGIKLIISKSKETLSNIIPNIQECHVCRFKFWPVYMEYNSHIFSKYLVLQMINLLLIENLGFRSKY